MPLFFYTVQFTGTRQCANRVCDKYRVRLEIVLVVVLVLVLDCSA